MPSIDSDGGIDQVTASVTALQAAVIATQGSLATVQASIIAAEATLATLNAGNFYTKTEANTLLAAKAPASHTHPLGEVTGFSALGSTFATLSSAAAGRTALELGTAAVVASSAFEPAGSTTGHNNASNAHEILLKPKLWRLTYQGSDEHTRVVEVTTQPSTGATWLSFFPTATGYTAGPATAIPADWSVIYSATLSGYRASITRSDVVSGSSPGGGD